MSLRLKSREDVSAFPDEFISILLLWEFSFLYLKLGMSGDYIILPNNTDK